MIIYYVALESLGVSREEQKLESLLEAAGWPCGAIK